MGRSVKIKFKKTKFSFQKVGWSIMIYDFDGDFLRKNWKKKAYLRSDCFDKKHNITGCADPFLIPFQQKVFLFFEAIVNGKGEIWVSEYEKGKISNSKCALAEPFHLSYPNVFIKDNAYYLIPESSEDNSVRLYKTTQFPFKWEFVKILIKGAFVDTNFIEKDEFYYWFTYDLEIKKTRLFYSMSLFDEWIEHINSPFESNRNAGNFIVDNDKILRPVQLAHNAYGEGVKLMEIKFLDKNLYEEAEFINPFLKKKNGFSLDGSHHISVLKTNQENIVAVDGKNNNFFKII